LICNGCKKWVIEPWVVWDDGDGYILLDQSNRALWDRWIHNIKHHLNTNYPLEADWSGTYKKPAFPRFTDRSVYVEYVSKPEYRTVKEGKLRTLTETTTTVLIARASYESAAKLATEADAILELQKSIFALREENERLQLQQGLKVQEMTIHGMIEADRKTPQNKMFAIWEKSKELINKNTKIAAETALIQKEEAVEKEKEEKEEVKKSGIPDTAATD
jgi:hypothetical protein